MGNTFVANFYLEKYINTNKNIIDPKRVYLLKYEQTVCICRKRALRINYTF